MTPAAETALLAIAGMAVVTYVTRAGGLWFMARIRSTPRVESFVRHLSGGVLAGLVCSALLRGDGATWLALTATAVTMLLTRRLVLAILAGAVAAALWRG